MLLAFDDREEMVACELSHLARKAAAAVGQQYLGLAVAARIEQDVAHRRVAGVVLEVHAQLELAERDPARFAAPAHMNDLLPIGQQLREGRHRLRRVGVSDGEQAKVGRGNPDARHDISGTRWAIAMSRDQPPWYQPPDPTTGALTAKRGNRENSATALRNLRGRGWDDGRDNALVAPGNRAASSEQWSHRDGPEVLVRRPELWILAAYVRCAASSCAARRRGRRTVRRCQCVYRRARGAVAARCRRSDQPRAALCGLRGAGPLRLRCGDRSRRC